MSPSPGCVVVRQFIPGHRLRSVPPKATAASRALYASAQGDAGSARAEFCDRAKARLALSQKDVRAVREGWLR